MQIWSVEGNLQHFDGGTMFGNAPRSLWEKWVRFDDKNRIRVNGRALLARGLDGKNILFEAGVGAFFPPKLRERYGIEGDENMLLKSLEQRGVPHDQIDAVVLNHMHFDHVGGLLAAWREGRAPELLFPKARFLVSASAWERANKPHPRDHASFIPELPDLLRASGRLEVVGEDGVSSLGRAVRFGFSHGHTPGLMTAELGGNGGVAFPSDLVLGRAWVHLPITTGLDRFAEQLVDEKKAFLEDKVARGVRLFFVHDPDCALATPVKDENGRFAVKEELKRVEGLEI